jgi:hypothetical protein
MKRTIRTSLLAIVLCLVGLFADNTASANGWPGAERRLTRLPHTEQELVAAHTQAASFAAIMVPPRRPFESHDGSEQALCHVGGNEVRIPCNRRGLIAMGSDMSPDDQKRLPFISGGIILDEVGAYFMSIQIRAATAPGGVPYLLDRPMIALAKYNDTTQTFPSTDIVDHSVRDIRSLGFLTRTDGGANDPPRTIAIAVRNMVAVDSSPRSKVEPHYECMFMHARTDPSGRALITHSFGTTLGRTKLHHFTPIGTPKRLADCAIQGTIFFTDYAFGGQYPTAKATRNVKLNSVGSFDVPQIDRWLAARGIKGDTWDHLPLVFDAIIDGTLPKN